MKQVYTNENRLLAMNSKNRLENAGINVRLKNEYCSDGATPGHQAWLELWVDDGDYQDSLEVLKTALSDCSTEWTCQSCKEENSGEFKICWNCQQALSV
ncbi:MAG: DUF2007 domain-containing protein [Kangiellaceae bacterium]|nr:DUF2007 domain-containing protein [Kangiellaceae bacterium]